MGKEELIISEKIWGIVNSNRGPNESNQGIAIQCFLSMPSIPTICNYFSCIPFPQQMFFFFFLPHLALYLLMFRRAVQCCISLQDKCLWSMLSNDSRRVDDFCEKLTPFPTGNRSKACVTWDSLVIILFERKKKNETRRPSWTSLFWSWDISYLGSRGQEKWNEKCCYRKRLPTPTWFHIFQSTSCGGFYCMHLYPFFSFCDVSCCVLWKHVCRLVVQWSAQPRAAQLRRSVGHVGVFFVYSVWEVLRHNR